MKRILVAEDNDSNYLLMTYILKGHYEPVRAHNGEEAIELVESEKPDLVLMDLKMPIMDGLESTRRIREKYPTLPIIAVTANAFNTDREEALAAGCSECVCQPVSNEQGLEALARLIG